MDTPQPDQSSPDCPTPKRALGFRGLFVVLVFVSLIQPLVPEWGIYGRLLTTLLFVLALTASTASVTWTKKARTLVYGLAGVAFLSGWVAAGVVNPWVQLLAYVSYIAFFGAVCANVLDFVFMHESGVHAEKLYAVCCVYFLAAIGWAFLYATTELLTPGAFSFASEAGTHEFSDFVYFSLVTLTTVGYGDITPVSRFARVCATLEAMSGQMYLAVLVARLVGATMASKRASPG